MSEQQKPKSELDSLIIAYPCPIKWESMKGDERKRFCDQCSMQVINISDMSTTEANEYLRKTRDAENSCVKFYLRSDGTIKTDNCPSFLKPIKRKIVYLNKVISITMAVSLSWLTSLWKDGANAKEHRFIQLTPVETLNVVGRPAPTDISTLIEKLLFTGSIGDLPYDLREKFNQSLSDTRGVDLKIVEELKENYQKKKLEDKYFYTCLLEMLMRIKSFEDDATLDKDLLKVETLRLKLMNDKLKNAESRVAQKKKTGITASIQDFMSLATITPSLAAYKHSYPDKARTWQLPLSCGKSDTVVASREMLTRAMNCIQKADPEKSAVKSLKDDLTRLLAIKDKEKNNSKK
ncbi:MAG: hypothetical protein SFY67_01370 [Candidatus Melainabacteria bacterium]|nr:hypothetical protein [Candidatus Melainabacteria bacterium]